MRRWASVLCFCLLSGAVFSPGAVAQDTPRPDSQRDSSRATTQLVPALAWLFDYDGQPADHLIADQRFDVLLKQYFPDTKMKPWGDKSLPDVALQFLKGSTAKVLIDRDRYVTAPSYALKGSAGQGMLWVDTRVHAKGGQPIVVFAALLDAGSKPSRLWLISNKNYYNDPFSTPPRLRVSISRWLMLPKRKQVLKISRFTVIDPTGKKEQDVTPAILGVPLALVDLGN